MSSDLGLQAHQRVLGCVALRDLVSEGGKARTTSAIQSFAFQGFLSLFNS